MTTEAPRLKWTRNALGYYEATDAKGATWTIDQHPTVPSRQGKNPDWSEKWWLHPAGPETPETHEMCPIVTRRKITALHRHPDILRYADVLAAGWDNACWRIQNGEPLAEQVMRRGDQHAPLSGLLGKPVMIHPQRLLNAELRASDYQRRAYAAEQALRDAGLPVPESPRRS
ncbi:hypothetical protein [Streptomyces sp. NPDC057623]|uniref:hypothetical protein n=1 Tax=Streptomyces sp. NPDC057623 TaxID=3346187 RepID=UPI0036970FAF